MIFHPYTEDGPSIRWLSTFCIQGLGACSVLESGRSITLAERGGAGAEEIVAAPGFRIVATMNPGGDYGKRELSPALANRFTSIWVPAIDDVDELTDILHARLTGQTP